MKFTLFTNMAFVTAFFAQGILATDILASFGRFECQNTGVGCQNFRAGACCTNYDDGRILTWRINNGPQGALLKAYESAYCDPNKGATLELRASNGCIDAGATGTWYRAAKWWVPRARLHNKDMDVAEDFENQECEKVRPNMVFLPKVGTAATSDKHEDRDYFEMPKGGYKTVMEYMEKEDYDGLRAYLEAEKAPRLYRD